MNLLCFNNHLVTDQVLIILRLRCLLPTLSDFEIFDDICSAGLSLFVLLMRNFSNIVDIHCDSKSLCVWWAMKRTVCS